MIVVKIMGGLGNQMFQYAFGRALALKNNTIMKIDTQNYKNDELREFQLDIFNLKVDFASKQEIKKLKYIKENIAQNFFRKIQKGVKPFNNSYYVEKQFDYNSSIKNYLDDIYYEGYWQSEKYFLEYRDILFGDFMLKNKIHTQCLGYQKKIVLTQSVSLHVRRGDYISNPQVNSVHGTCDLMYYENAVDFIKTKIENPIFFIFSDDLQWAKENLNFIENILFVELGKDVHDSEEMYLMSQCKHNIIANSSFSWWGAWLNQNPDKIVIAPHRWFSDHTINTKDLIPESWIRL